MLIIAIGTFLGLTLVSCGDDSSPTKNTPVNRAPGAPTIDTANGAPADAATDVSAPVTLHWTCSDPDGDALTYDVRFGTTSPPPAVSTAQAATSHGPVTVVDATTYYWQIVASDPDGLTTASEVWSFTMAAAGVETVNAPSVPGGSTSAEIGQSTNFTAFGAVSSEGHPVQYRFDWADGTMSPWSSATTAQHSWSSAGDFGVKAQARCADHTTIESVWSAQKTVTVLTTEVTGAPDAPSGPASGVTGESLSYTVSGAVNSRGHAVEYRIDWGGGAYSTWSSNTTFSHTWSAVDNYQVRAMARCQAHPTVESAWSSAHTVAIALPGETVGVPGNGAGPVGPDAGAVDTEQTFTINYPSVSNLGHAVEHQFDWGDGQTSSWAAALTANHTWTTPGSYTVKIRGRCIEHPTVVSGWTTNNPTIEITDAGEALSDPVVQYYVSTVKAFVPVFYHINNVTSNIGHQVEYQMDWGPGGLSEWQDGSTFSYMFEMDGPVEIRGHARCKLHPAIVSNWSPVQAFTVAENNSVMDPVTPTSGYAGYEIAFTTGASTNSSGHTVEYRFSWGSGEGVSDWSTSTTANHLYETPGTKSVQVTARCQDHPTVTRTGAIQPVYLTWQPTTETITTPGQPTGPATGLRNTPIVFSTTVCTSNEGHEVWYRFRAVRSGSLALTTGWSTSPSQELTFTSTGGYSIYADARCSIHPEANSSSTAGYITISNP